MYAVVSKVLRRELGVDAGELPVCVLDLSPCLTVRSNWCFANDCPPSSNSTLFSTHTHTHHTLRLNKNQGTKAEFAAAFAWSMYPFWNAPPVLIPRGNDPSSMLQQLYLGGQGERHTQTHADCVRARMQVSISQRISLFFIFNSLPNRLLILCSMQVTLFGRSMMN